MAQQVALNIDCLEYMRTLPDKAFDLAIVDPPYGGGGTPCRTSPAGGLTDTSIAIGKITRTGGTWAAKYQSQGGVFSRDISYWDIAPDKSYFDELFRLSKDQIIWGGNYFGLPPARCFIVWRKLQIPLEGFSMSPVEYAWTSFAANASMFEAYSNGGSGREARFHPTQKPVELYEWLLRKYAKRWLAHTGYALR